MTLNIKFDKFDDDVKIIRIGPLFRKTDGNRWGINLQLSPRHKQSSLTISNAPVLARRRVLNPTVVHKPAGWSEIFEITDTRDWAVKKIGECPSLSKISTLEADQLCFFFEIENGKNVYLPQFELARALFFHDSYMARTAIDPDCLDAEFDINIDNVMGKAIINAMPSSGYTLNHYNNPYCRRMLSWILVDDEARKSYTSIGRYQMMYGNDAGGYRYWDFQFDTPLLPLAKFRTRGKFDRETNSLFVFEIDAILNLEANVPEDIEFYHPEFRTLATGSGTGLGGAAGQAPDEVTVLDDSDADTDGGKLTLHAPSIRIEFSKAFKTSKVSTKTRKAKSGRKTDDLEDEPQGGVSTEESVAGHGLRGADWDNIDDLTDDAHLYMNKFAGFQKMIEQLEAEHGCIIKSMNLSKLPKVPRCKKHILTTDGNPRCLAVAEIYVTENTVYVLELDMSDAYRPLSTQVLWVENSQLWDHHLKTLERELVRNSLRWPIQILRRICGGRGYLAVPHPKTKSDNKAMLEPESIKSWASRLYLNMTK